MLRIDRSDEREDSDDDRHRHPHPVVLTPGAAPRPNILMIMVDQLADQWLDLALTPAIDGLAAEGLRFTSTYSNSPLCAPARFAMLSGRRNSTIGAYDNASEFPAAIPTFVHHLRAGGYQTSLVGKMHFVGPDQLHGFEERITTDIYPADFGWTPDWSQPDQRADWWFHNMDSVTGAGVADASNQLDYDDEVGFRAVRKLRDLARSDDTRPWFLTVSFTHPHDPYVAREEYWDSYEPDAVPLPVVPSVASPDPHSLRLAALMQAGVHPLDSDQIRRARRAYLANVTYVDRFVEQMLSVLRRTGVDDHTVVLFTSDHGDMLGERGLWYKMNFFEPSARVPLIVRAPGQLTPGVVSTNTSLLDIGPTLLDLAGLDSPEELEGTSLLRLGPGTNDARTIFGEYLGEGALAPVLMIKRGSLKYVWSAPDPPQLYDLAADPLELENLAPAMPVAADFAAEVHDRWHVEAIDRQVRSSQRARRLVDRALRRGSPTAWDHQPPADADRQYMRNHLDLNQVEASRRLP